ncbi:MAG: hypothetical protein J6I31_00120 [Prevotella sp.]|nr:hypothetical protein [Prevotella sp.]
MKRLHDIVCTLCGLLLFSCGQQYEPELIAIDSMADTSPDSAAVLLSKFDTLNVSEGNRMYYYLLRAKVSDHLDQLDATTEEAEQLVTYFEDDGDEHLLPIAYYYGGRICAENSNVPQALDYFHKAEVLLTDGHSLPMPEDDQDKALLSKVYSQMGYLFVYRNMYEEARRCSEQSYELDKDINDTVGMIFNLRDIGISYKWADKEREALPYFYQARTLANKAHDEFMKTSVCLQLAGTYLDLNKVDSAKKYVLPLLNMIERTDSTAILSILSDFYHKSNQTDSAEYYSQRLLLCRRKDAQCHAHQILAEINIRKNRSAEALQHYREYQELRYWIDKANSTADIAQANSAYNYQKKEAENYELKIENDHKEKILLMTVAAIIVLVLAFFLFFNRYRHRQATKLKELERIKEELFRQSEEYRQQSRQRIAELEVQLQDAGTTNDELRQQLENEKGKLEASLEMAIVKEREAKQSLRIIRDSNAYRQILRLTNDGSPQTITDEDWKELSAIINQEYKGFTQRLFELCGKMSELEYRVCLLIKADTDLNKMAEILIKAQPTISTTRSRLYQKAFGKKDSAKDWDAVINSL